MYRSSDTGAKSAGVLGLVGSIVCLGGLGLTWMVLTGKLTGDCGTLSFNCLTSALAVHPVCQFVSLLLFRTARKHTLPSTMGRSLANCGLAVVFLLLFLPYLLLALLLLI